jgi:ribonuclease-3
MENNNEVNIIRNIYNKNNILINIVDINNILKLGKIKIKIKNITIWKKSFIHKSYCKTHRKRKKLEYTSDDSENSDIDDKNNIIELQDISNERLEWLGDGQIQAIVASYLYERYPDEDEGFLTKLRSKLVKTEGLSNLAKSIGLSKFILMSKHVEKNCDGRNNKKILENTFEAFIGALYYYILKYNNAAAAYSITYDFLINILEQFIDITNLIKFDDNYKDRLMRFYQAKYDGKYPIYKEINNNNDISIRSFEMAVFDPDASEYLSNFHDINKVKDKIIGIGKGKCKKDAEQLAAKNALIYYKII